MKKGWKQRATGFTIVELLIVIVVIAVLAAITVVAFNGIQDRSRDGSIRSGANQLEKAIRLWATQTGQLPRGGWSSTGPLGSADNCADGSGGWVSSGSYPCALEDMLVAKQLLPSGFTQRLPTNSAYTSTNGIRSTMFYPCTGGKYALYWNLRNPSAEDTASIAYVESQGCPTSPRTSYGMRAAKLLDLN